MKNKIAIIVVTYNRLHLLKECIVSLRNQTYKDRDIIVINNGSTDSTSNWLSSQNDLIILNQENLGGAGGFYTGIKYACENGYTYTWVMDDDVIADPKALENLYNKVEFVSGFICSKVLDIEDNLCNVPKISTQKSLKTGEPIWGNLLDKQLLRVDITSFVSMFFNNSIVSQIGLPYKEYFIWGDDTEYSSRISSNFASYMAIDSIVTHKREIQSILSIFSETDKRRIKNYFFAYRNRIHCQNQYLGKLYMVSRSIYDFLKLLATGRLYKSYIVLKALLASIIFKPTINFPNNA